MYKHLLLINDGEIEINELHLTDDDRARSLLTAIADQDHYAGEVRRRVEETLLEAAEEGAAAEYDPAEGQPFVDDLEDGLTAQTVAAMRRPGDYLDAVQETLADIGYDLYRDDLTPQSPATDS